MERIAATRITGIALSDPPDDKLLTALLSDGREVSLYVSLVDLECAERISEGLEYVKAAISSPYVIVNLLSHSGQWGRTLVWDSAEDRIVHASASAYGYCSAISGDQVVTLCVVAHWGQPAQAAYFTARLDSTDIQADHDLHWLDLSIPDRYYDPEVLKLRVSEDGVVCIVGDAEQAIAAGQR